MRDMVFQTPRLMGVEIEKSDVSFLTHLFNEESNYEQVGFERYSNDQIREMVASYQAERNVSPRVAFRLVMLEKENGQPVGTGSIKNIPGEDIYPDLGVMIDSSQRLQGYATEIIAGLTRLAFFHFNTTPIVMTTCSPENQASLKLLARSGYKIVEHRKQDFFNGRNLEDTLVHHMGVEDWAFRY